MTEEQFRDTVLPYHRIMTGVAMAILGNREDALDCMQDSLEALWHRRNELERMENVRAYCITTVRNTALSVLRRQTRMENVVPEIVDRISPETRLEDSDRLEKVLGLIESLPDAQRDVLKLSTIIGLPPDEVASMSGLSPGNVRTLLSRARKQLRKHFKL